MDMTLAKWKWLWGQPIEFWITHEKYVKAFIKENKLEPINAIVDRQTKISEAIIDIEYLTGKYGGNRGPHLHYRNEKYILNSDQWQRFTRPIIAEFSKKLANAATVNFEQFVEIDNIMNSIF